MTRTVAISQSNYVPWRGYFDMIDRADVFVLLDEVQYTKRDWRSRNRIKTEQGPSWITVPVQAQNHRDQRIDETLVADRSWAESHWARIAQAYRAAPCFDADGPGLQAAYEEAARHERLSEINRGLIEYVCGRLGITTPLHWSTDFDAQPGATERLLSLCRELEADVYLSGPAARAYLDASLFSAAGIRVEWMDYSGYPEYPQLHGPFEPQVSVVDLLLNTGGQAADLFRSTR